MSVHSLTRPAIIFRHNALPTLRSTASRFHTSGAPLGRWVRDRNKKRGVSALNRRPKQNIQISVTKVPLPEPVPDSERTPVQVDPEHGLWGFFYQKRALPTPEEDHKIGRPWTADELRKKSWEDLQRLWWVCVRERNVMETQKLERSRLKPGYGEYEANARHGQIRVTQRAIKHVLTERYYVWQEAQKVAATDEEIDLSGKGPAYVPADMEKSPPVEAPKEPRRAEGAGEAKTVDPASGIPPLVGQMPAQLPPGKPPVV